MDFLDQMLAEAQAAARPKKSKGAGVPGGDPVARENLYKPYRLVALFNRTTCACGAVTDVFEGIFEERRHIRVSDTHLVREPVANPETTLPRVRKYLQHTSLYCAQ